MVLVPPTESSGESLAFDCFNHVLLGVYVWEWIISLDFEWQFITRKKRFHWPMIFYFLNRYIMLFSIIGVVIGLDVTSQINCQALYTYDIVLGASAIGLASINLSLRTMAVWSMRRYIVVPLTIIIFGQFGFLLLVVTLKGTWIPGKGCVITHTDDPKLMAAFIYTMIFDFIVLSLMAVKLFKTSTGSRSRLSQLLFKDGLIYFIIAFLSNSVAMTLNALRISPIMSLIANVPAAILTSIVACRVVRRLNNYSSSGPETFSTLTPGSYLAFRSHTNVPTMVPKDETHIQVATGSTSQATNNNDTAGIADAGEMGPERSNRYDPESQAVYQSPVVPPSAP